MSKIANTFWTSNAELLPLSIIKLSATLRPNPRRCTILYNIIFWEKNCTNQCTYDTVGKRPYGCSKVRRSLSKVSLYYAANLLKLACVFVSSLEVLKPACLSWFCVFPFAYKYFLAPISSTCSIKNPAKLAIATRVATACKYTLCPKKTSPTFLTVTWKPIIRFW